MVDTTIIAPIAVPDEDANPSAVSWGAIIAGGVTAAAVSLVLLILGTGLGLTAISPWPGASSSVAAVGIGAVIWLIVTQWISAGLGGYLAGRLRTKWVGVHTDEVFFRDTAHGFLSWALATVISAALLASAVSAVVGAATTAATSVASGAAQGLAQSAAASSPTDYFVDTLFRPGTPAPAAPAPAAATPPAAGPAGPASNRQDIRTEATRIFAKGLAEGDLNAPDRTYLAQLVASQTGLSQQDAEKRIDDVVAQAKAAAEKVKQAADAARKAASTFAFFSFFSLLIGAFIASAAAALGGRERDENEIASATR